jgi:MFS superfamily sulfate permease-like transporter
MLFALGLFIGVFVGIFVTALLVVSRDSERRAEEMRKKEGIE